MTQAHDNAWYVQNFDAQVDLRSRAQDLRDQARHLLLEATSLERIADDLAQLSSVFEGQGISVSESGTDQLFLRSLPPQRAAMIFRDRQASDGRWTGVFEDQSGESGIGVGANTVRLSGDYTKGEALLVAKRWVAHGTLPA